MRLPVPTQGMHLLQAPEQTAETGAPHLQPFPHPPLQLLHPQLPARTRQPPPPPGLAAGGCHRTVCKPLLPIPRHHCCWLPHVALRLLTHPRCWMLHARAAAAPRVVGVQAQRLSSLVACCLPLLLLHHCLTPARP